MEIYYENTKGERLNLTEWPYRIYSGDLLDYEWGYDYTARQFGGKIYRFSKPVKEFPVELSVRADTKEAYYAALEQFYRAVEIDVVRGTPGKLYINGSYLSCYILSSAKTEWEGDTDSLDNEITVVAEYPFWIDEESKFFPAISPEALAYAYLDYPYGYPFDYMPSQGSFSLVNRHFSDSEFIITFYGSCRNPSVRIGDYVYGVNTYIPAGYRAEINSADKTVRLIGEQAFTNVFHLRTTANSVFQKIGQGQQSVQKNGAFEMAITLRNERSEPAWT